MRKFSQKPCFIGVKMQRHCWRDGNNWQTSQRKSTSILEGKISFDWWKWSQQSPKELSKINWQFPDGAKWLHLLKQHLLWIPVKWSIRRLDNGARQRNHEKIWWKDENPELRNHYKFSSFWKINGSDILKIFQRVMDAKNILKWYSFKSSNQWKIITAEKKNIRRVQTKSSSLYVDLDWEENFTKYITFHSKLN